MLTVGCSRNSSKGRQQQLIPTGDNDSDFIDEQYSLGGSSIHQHASNGFLYAGAKSSTNSSWGISTQSNDFVNPT